MLVHINPNVYVYMYIMDPNESYVIHPDTLMYMYICPAPRPSARGAPAGSPRS